MVELNQTEDLENGAVATPLSKPYEKIKYNITVKDLKNPVLAKHLIYENECLKTKEQSLERVEKDYYQSKTVIARYEEREKKNWTYEIFKNIFMTISGVFFGLITHDFSKENSFNWLMLILGMTVLAGAVLSCYLPLFGNKKKGA